MHGKDPGKVPGLFERKTKGEKSIVKRSVLERAIITQTEIIRMDYRSKPGGVINSTGTMTQVITESMTTK